MKILFVMRHPAAVRSLGSVLRLLDARGHRVHLAFGGIKPEAHKVLQRLADECDGLTFGSLPGRRSPGWDRGTIGWSMLAKRLRVDSDYLRYLEPSYADAPALRARAAGNAHPLIRRAARVAGLGGPAGARTLRRTLELVERCLEPPPHVERFLADFEPDVVLVTHLARDSVQVDYVRAAKRLGLHTAYPVFSWDNLTNKGLVHEVPELVLVWNEIQADEAVELQGIPREQVRVAGAWSYDHWFEWQPSRSREEFCAEVGLRADRPIVLYVCSSGFVARDEVGFVRRWIEALRQHGGLLGEAGVIVRPHPRNSSQWAGCRSTIPRRRSGRSSARSRSRSPRGRTTSTRSTTRPRSSGSTRARRSRARSSGGRCTRCWPTSSARPSRGRSTSSTCRRTSSGISTSAGRWRSTSTSWRSRFGAAPTTAATSASCGGSCARSGSTSRRRRCTSTRSRSWPPARRRPDRGPAAGPLVRLALAPLAALAARRVRRRRKPSAAEDDELRAVVRRLKREESRVVAGPWLGSETAELLYWIPFLRWVQTATLRPARPPDRRLP